MYYGEKLKQLRIDKKLSLRQLATKISSESNYISHVNLARIENGGDSKGKIKESVPIDTLKDILYFLNYDFALFLAETGYLNPERVCMNQAEIEVLKGFRENFNKDFVESIEKNEIISKKVLK